MTMKAIKELPVNERPRERIRARGVGTLSDIELIATVLGRGTRKDDLFALARRTRDVLDRNNFNLSADQLGKESGIGFVQATKLLAAFEFYRRRRSALSQRIHSVKDILPLISYLADRKQEHFVCLSLNGAMEVVQVRVITVGLADRSIVHPREVFADAITDRASAIIVAHNHPASLIEPSPADIKTTKALYKAGEIIGIKLLDHVIFNRHGFYSMAEHDQLGEL